jgi:hypothetical protein
MLAILLLPAADLRAPSSRTGSLPEELRIRVGVVAPSAEHAREALGHYRQSPYLMTSVEWLAPRQWDQASLGRFDLLEVQGSPPAAAEDVSNRLERFVRQGGVLAISRTAEGWLPQSVLGLAAEPSPPRQVRPTYPPVDAPWLRLQELWRLTLVSSRGGGKSWLEERLFPPFVRTAGDLDSPLIAGRYRSLGMAPLVSTSDHGVLLGVRDLGRGVIIWRDEVPPFAGEYRGLPAIREFSLGYPDPKAENFWFAGATAAYLLRAEYVGLTWRRRYGFALRRTFGPYGRPLLCWQNHLDQHDEWREQSALRWADILRRRGQIPSFSISKTLLSLARDDPEQGAALRALVRRSRADRFPLALHLEADPTSTAEEELAEIRSHQELLAQFEVPPELRLGLDHHIFYVHARPVWQSPRVSMQAGLKLDHGFSGLSNFAHYREFFCASAAFQPYCVPFRLAAPDGRPLNLLLWTPAPWRAMTAVGGGSGYDLLPSAFDLPINVYFHSEFIGSARRLADCHPEIQALVARFDRLLTRDLYSMMTLDQAARYLETETACSWTGVLNGDRLTLRRNDRAVPATNREWTAAVGIRIEPGPGIQRLVSAAPVQWLTPRGDLCLSGSSDLQVRLEHISGNTESSGAPERWLTRRPQEPSRALESPELQASPRVLPVAANSPFRLTESPDEVAFRFDLAGMGQVLFAWHGRTLQPAPGPETRLERLPGALWRLTSWGPAGRRARVLLVEPERARYLELLSTADSDRFPIQRLDFGTPSAREFLRQGWCMIDEAWGEDTIVWSDWGLSSSLEAPLAAQEDLCLQLRVAPITTPDGREQEMTISLNGYPVTTLSLRPGLATYEVLLPSRLLIQGMNRFDLAYRVASAPSLNNISPGDHRLLAVAHDWWEFRPCPP